VHPAARTSARRRRLAPCAARAAGRRRWQLRPDGAACPPRLCVGVRAATRRRWPRLACARSLLCVSLAVSWNKDREAKGET